MIDGSNRTDGGWVEVDTKESSASNLSDPKISGTAPLLNSIRLYRISDKDSGFDLSLVPPAMLRPSIFVGLLASVSVARAAVVDVW